MNTTIKAFLSVLIITIMAGPSLAGRLIQLEVTVRQENSEGQYVLISKKNLSVSEGIKNSGFMANFTIDLIADYDGNGYYNCEFSLFTIGSHAQNLYKKFQSDEGGVYFIENVRGKNGIVYRVGISPLAVDSSQMEIETCDYDYRAEGVWNFDPSANFDFYFVPRTLGDARWNLLRDYVEINYRQFRDKFKPGFPGKINCFFAPCQLREVSWDMRAGYAIDPSRSNCLMLYSHNNNTIDGFPVNLLRIYKYLGYAPPMLAEGMAGYFDLPHYYAQELKKTNELPPITQLIKSIDYFNQPGYNNISAASSFVSYLIDVYSEYRFIELYRKSNDLNITEQFPIIYDKTMNELEAEWLNLLDTLTIPAANFRYYYERDKYLQNKSGMNRFLGELKEKLLTPEDTSFVFGEEAWNLYMAGDYTEARALYEFNIAREPENSSWLMIYANLLLLDGQHDSALATYDNLYAIDSMVKTVFYKKGDTYFRMDEIDSAKSYLMLDISDDPSNLSKASSGILSGRLALAEGDTSTARDFYAGALDAMEQIYQFGPSSPAFLLRMGQAHFGLAMCGEETLTSAKSFLEQALYFEVYPTRAVFITRILRELGHLADIEGNREQAIEYYQKALSYPLPLYYEKEVRSYIVEPFTGYYRGDN